MRLTGGLVFDPERGFLPRDLCIEQGIIVPQAEGAVDVSGCYLIPGLTDLHFHGCMGEDFSDASPAGLMKIADYQLSQGITQICPAGMTLPEDTLTAICKTAAAHKAANPGGAELVGVNLEGPFLSMAKKGAQNGAYLHAPDPALLHRLQRAAGGLVKLVTLAGELPGALPFIQSATAEGITVSLGHTTADYAAACAAFDAGARQVTHLFNAMPPFGHREPGVVGAAFDHPEVRVELICDGVHIHPSVIRAVFRLFGAERVIMVSDSLRATGMPDGQYPFGGQTIEVHAPRATMVGDPATLAGSVSDLMQCVRTVTTFGIPLASAVTAAAVNPAKALGIYQRVGSLDIGKLANVAVLDRGFNLKAVVFHGELVSGEFVKKT